MSPIHAPTGCGQVAVIVSATEAILRKTPKSRVLICSRTNAAADTIAEGLKLREHLCDFTFEYLRFLPRTTTELQDVRAIICACAASGVERHRKSRPPQVLLVDNASRLRHYEVVVPFSAHVEHQTRLVLVGDYVRNDPAASTASGQMAWAKSIFERMTEERWPKQILDVNYLTHPGLWYLTSLVLCENRSTAARSTTDPLIIPK